jgi:ADP-ribosyl-[dinitrogen reductase] hydrolase
VQPIRLAAHGDWRPYRSGTPLDAVATVASVLYVLREATGVASAMKCAVALGGDTDTAAAIVGGILGCRLDDFGSAIPWLSRVVVPNAEIIEATAVRLCELRRSRYG